MARDGKSLGPAVLNGEIQYLSVSQITEFDQEAAPDTGCPRKWFAKKVLGKKEPPKPWQEQGTDFHSTIEHYIKTGEDVLPPTVRAGKHFIPKPGPGLHVELEFTREKKELLAAGVPLVGFIDLLNESGFYLDSEGVLTPERKNTIEVCDWKTTSSIEKWAKAGSALPRTVQMAGYGIYAANRFKALEQVRLSHVYFQTKGPAKSEKRMALVPLGTVKDQWSRVEKTVREMKDVARESEMSRVTANYNACGAYGGCFLRDVCPRNAKAAIASIFGGGNAMSSFLSKLKGGKTEAPAAPANGSVKAKDAKQGETYYVKLGGGYIATSYICLTKGGHSFARDDGEGVLLVQGDDEVFSEIPNTPPAVLPPDAPAPGVSGPIAQPLPAGAEVSPAIAAAAAKVAPTPPAEEAAPVKRKPGRPRKTEAAAPVEPAQAAPPPATEAPAPVQAAPALPVQPEYASPPVATYTATFTPSGAAHNPPAPTPAFAMPGIVLFVNAFPVKGEAKSLEDYIGTHLRGIEKEFNVPDVRVAEKGSALAYGAWKGVISAAVREAPPEPGAYFVTGARESELKAAFVEALTQVASVVIQGV